MQDLITIVTRVFHVINRRPNPVSFFFSSTIFGYPMDFCERSPVIVIVCGTRIEDRTKEVNVLHNNKRLTISISVGDQMESFGNTK